MDAERKDHYNKNLLECGWAWGLLQLLQVTEQNVKGEKVLFYPFEARKQEKEHANCGSGRVLIFRFIFSAEKLRKYGPYFKI